MKWNHIWAFMGCKRQCENLTILSLVLSARIKVHENLWVVRREPWYLPTPTLFLTIAILPITFTFGGFSRFRVWKKPATKADPHLSLRWRKQDKNVYNSKWTRIQCPCLRWGKKHFILMDVACNIIHDSSSWMEILTKVVALCKLCDPQGQHVISTKSIVSGASCFRKNKCIFRTEKKIDLIHLKMIKNWCYHLVERQALEICILQGKRLKSY